MRRIDVSLSLSTRTMSDINLPWLDPDDESFPFPDASSALKDPEGLVAAGGDLSPKRVLRAYREGIFPWYEEDQPILWWSPNPRGIIYPKKFIAHKRLLRTLKKKKWLITYDNSFTEVMEACAEPRTNSRGTWITPDMLQAYTLLHQLGHAHSIEVRDHNNYLIGGVYGVAIGSIFFGESMFSRETDTSKVALLYLCAYLDTWGYKMIDTQLSSNHLSSLGGIDIPREEYLYILHRLTKKSVDQEAWRKDYPLVLDEWLNTR